MPVSKLPRMLLAFIALLALGILHAHAIAAVLPAEYRFAPAAGLGSCEADAGILTPLDANPCLVDGVAILLATAGDDAVVPDGQQILYVLTQGEELAIINAQTDPFFGVNSIGLYTIHTLVYDPNTLDLFEVVIGETTAYDLASQMIQGGGEVCAAMDVVGAAFNVTLCGEPCEANAGSISTSEPEPCLLDGVAFLHVNSQGSGVIPPGYEMVFVLTSGPALVIIDIDLFPFFTVTQTGGFATHPLVYDPATFDLSTVELGVTTAFDVDALLIQGGGAICGSLDMVGATYNVTLCEDPCEADAGTLSGGGVACVVAGTSPLMAFPDGNSVVPDGFETVYVLTFGAELTIIGMNTVPEFIAESLGIHTIHTLVYDPDTLDLSFVEMGVTSAYDVNALLTQGGGTVCASLDMAGVMFSVEDCQPPFCDAYAGTLEADEEQVCLQNGTAVISATAQGDAAVPDGYGVAYALSLGPDLVIVGLSFGPVFTVSQAGEYIIHTLVIDPLTIDPGLVELGVTTGYDIHALLIQGGGQICGALDVAGAPVSVLDCTPANDLCADPTALLIELDCVPLPGDNTHAAPGPGNPGCDFSTVGYSDVWYTFNAGQNTSVNIDLDPGGMTDWGIVVFNACGGTEVACEVQPNAPLEVTVTPGADYVVRIYTNLQFGTGGPFTICLTAAIPSIFCDAGDVSTTEMDTLLYVCQDSQADVIAFLNSSLSTQAYTYILTDADDVIITQLSGVSLDFNGLPMGAYRVWGVSHHGALVGAVPGNTIGEVTSAGYCASISTAYVNVIVDICTGVEALSGQDWALFPNPTHGVLTLLHDGPETDVALRVFDMGGRLVHADQLRMGHGAVLPVTFAEGLVPAVYTVQLISDGRAVTMRLVVQR